MTKNTIDECRVGACNDRIYLKDLCDMHHERLIKTGTTRKPIEDIKAHGINRKGYLYKRRSSIMGRCYNKNCISYKNYGARGIKICERWKNSTIDFCLDIKKEIGDRPSKDHSLDRIDNDGDYEPGNLRWATRHEQMANRRCSNEIVGVTWNEWDKAWVACLKVNKKIYRKNFSTEQEAIKHRRYLEKEYLNV